MDDIAAWSALNEQMLAPTTACLALMTLTQVFRFAVRCGLITTNPITGLEPAEKPHWTPQQVAILQAADLPLLLAHTPKYRLLFDFLAHTGLRIGEALGLWWNDIDLDAGIIRVQRQLGRQRTIKPLKTPASRREVILAPALETLLRQHRLAATHTAPNDLVFATPTGTGIDYRTVGKEFRTAAKAARISHNNGRLTLHSLRHTYASLLIASGLDIVFVSRQLGHANPTITLTTYAHLFHQADHAAKARNALDASYLSTACDGGRALNE